MDRQTINPEILEEMIAAEIAMKYGCYPQARETLTRLVESHPNYLPAKEALEAVYRQMGEIELAGKTGKEIELVRSRLANQAAAQTTSVDGQEQIRRRIFIAGVDSIVREIYDMRDEEGVLRISALKIAESIRADRCVVVVREKDGLRARSHEYHKQGIGPSLDSRSAKLTFLISRLVSESSDPVVLVEPAKHAALAECRQVLECFNIQSIMACPLIYKYDRVGMIVAHRCAEPIEWREEEAVLMSTLAGHAAVALKNAQLFREAQAADVKDELTGLHNLSFFEQRLSVELRNAQQQNYPLCLATLSINDLEALRDTEGQAFADLVLHKVGFLLKTHLRKGSVVARSAVDQFMVILPSASEPVSHHIMSQIKSVVEQNLRADSGRCVEVGVAVTEVNTSRLPSPSVVKQNVKAPVAQEREAATLKGDLSDIPMQDIVQILENGRKCGRLVIDTGGQRGAIFFNSGKIVDAAFKDKAGEPALFELLGLGQAMFEYRPSETPFPQVIDSSNTYLLLEGSRLLDEANRNRTEAA